MQPTATPTAIPLPTVESDEPVAVIPTASVAPLDGQPDGERINVFTVTPRRGGFALEAAADELRQRVLRKPLTAAAVAFTLGFMLAGLRR